MARNVQWNPGKDPIPIIRDAARRGVGKAAEYVLGEARKQVPHDTGVLERSGRASHEGSGPTARGAVSFDTPYAVEQHENTNYRHKKGRKAKYLEDPLNASQNRMREIISDELRNSLK